MVQAFTGSSAVYEVEKGGRISLMNGFVTGGFVDLVSQHFIHFCGLYDLTIIFFVIYIQHILHFHLGNLFGKFLPVKTCIVILIHEIDMVFSGQ